MSESDSFLFEVTPFFPPPITRVDLDTHASTHTHTHTHTSKAHSEGK